MATLPIVADIEVESVTFPAIVNPPGSKANLFLGGAGVRGVDIDGEFVKFTAIGVYLESSAVPALAEKWKGKSAEELAEAVEFYRDIVTGPFEKFFRVTTIRPLTGKQYSGKVSENCIAFWKSVGIYTDTEAKAIDKFQEIFKEETFPPGSSILFTQFPSGSLAISFSKDGSLPETEKALIENKPLSEAVLETIIGKHGVSPATRQSLAARLSELLSKDQGTNITGIQVDTFTFPPTVKPPASKNTLFLGGAGVRGLEIDGKFVKFTAIGVYLEDSAVPALAVKWKGKNAQELTTSDEFHRDVVTGPFEKFIQVSMILPLTGQQYSGKVSENCAAIWKSMGIYTNAEEQALEKFSETFKEETFPPGSSILFTQFPSGSLAISFSKDGSFPRTEKSVIENKLLSETVLESIIGKHGVSPATRQSLAARMSKLLAGHADKN